MDATGFYENEEELEIFYGEEEDAGPEGKVNLEDGFNITRNNCGYLNLEYWAGITGYTVDQIIELADGKLMWRDPKQIELGADRDKGWLTREQVLTGNRIRKLKEAREMNDSRMDNVIRLLEENLPEEIDGEDIHVGLGSTWVLKLGNFIGNFIAELLHLTETPRVMYDPYRGKWSVESRQKPNYLLNFHTFGTSRMSCLHILEHKLNARPVKVFDQVYNPQTGGWDPVFNRAETLAAGEKARAIDTAFQDYCHGNKENEEILQKAYTDHYGYGLCRFDGDYLQLEDACRVMTPYKHQKDACAHILARPNVLLAHNVGSGKTCAYSLGIHELLRLGLCKKALIVVPNATLESAAEAYRNIFPMDHVIVCRPRREFSPENRAGTLQKIRSEESAVVFMAFSSFDMLTMTRAYAFAKKDAELRECSWQLGRAKTLRQKKALTAMMKRMIKAVSKYKEEFKDSETACFDEMGFTALVVDEAHNYKNITLDYSCDNIVGMHAKGSRKADNMLEKVRFIQEQNGRVIFATGTPITNSLADLYVLQYYLQPEELKLCNIYHFSDWINTFCEEEHSFEVDVDSKNCRFTTRFSRFHNLPELMAMFSDVCDFYQGDDGELGLPDFKGYTDIAVKKSKEQKAYIDKIAKRTEAIRAHEVNRRDDNLLKITVQGRLAALDIRLTEPDTPRTKENKVRVCAGHMAKLYFSYPDKCQIAFSDISTPKEGFNIYDELKNELIALGVRPGEIAFIHDAANESQRAALEQQFNAGEIRILVGSTAKLGTGSNVQERLVAVHHLDVPWRPADMVQRDGRIIRQGNSCREVYIYRYITESSFDAYTYQILENKQKFIAQFLSGSLSAVHRDESDCADTVLSYAEIKALAIGNPLIKERVEVSNRLEHARINQRHQRKELAELENLLARLPEMIAKRKKFIAGTEGDIAHYAKCRETVKNDERRSFGEEMLIAMKENVMQEKERYFSEYQGFAVILPKHMQYDKPYIILERHGGCRYFVEMDGGKVMGVCKRLDHCLDHLRDELNCHLDCLREYYDQQRQADMTLDAGNVYDEEVSRLAQKLKTIDDKLKEDAA